MSDKALLELDEVRAGYDAIEVLHGLSLSIAEGEIVTIIGANGAGKTTTLNAASGVLPLRGGRVRFGGKDVTGLPAHETVQLGMAHCPEGRRVFSRLSVLENLELGAFSRRDDSSAYRGRFRRRHDARVWQGVPGRESLAHRRPSGSREAPERQ